MKSLTLFLVVSCFLLLTCSREHPLAPADGEPGSIKLSVKLGAVGSLAKRAAIELDMLDIRLSASGENPIVDRIQLDGNDRQVITRTFSNIASQKTWTALAFTKDTAGKIIHSGRVDFETRPDSVIEVSLDLAAQYSMLRANFFPRRDSVDRCELQVDYLPVAAGYFSSITPPGDTVNLSYDYLTASAQGIQHIIRLLVWSTTENGYQPLYEGDTVITAFSGENTSYCITLRYLMPNPPPGSALMTVVLGTSGTVTINGEIVDGKRQTDIFVDASASPINNGLSWITAFNDLQKALGAAEVIAKSNPGAAVSIHIAEGVYYPNSYSGDSSTSFLLKNSIHLIGGYPRGGGTRDSANKTILSSARGCIHIIQALNVDSTAVLDGLTISGQGPRTKGSAMRCVNAFPKVINCNFTGNRFYKYTDEQSDNCGGAVFDSLSSPFFENCAFIDNCTDRGCGIYNVYSSPTIANCRFIRNISARYSQGLYLGGGGICNVFSSPRIIDCLFDRNHSVSGGAICNVSNSSPTITGCTFQGNSAREFQGGAIVNSHSDPLISNCIFSGNSAQCFGGGAIYNDSASPKIADCSFSGNSVNEFWSNSGGGAMANWNSSLPAVTNCTFDSNFTSKEFGLHGGAIFDSNSATTVTNCTFTANSATFGGAYYGCSATITNCIFWGDSAQDRDKPAIPSELSTFFLNVKNCIVFGGYPGGVSIIDQNPNLGELGNNGGPVPTCAISPDSPAKDAGSTVVPSGVDISTDARGQTRSDGKPDIGAYEVQ